MPENVVNFFNVLNHKIHDIWYQTLFALPFFVGIIQEKGKQMVTAENSNKWVYGILLTAILAATSYAINGLQRFTTLETRLEELAIDTKTNTETLREREKYIDVIARLEKDVQYVQDKLADEQHLIEKAFEQFSEERDRDKNAIYARIDEDKAFAMRRLQNAVEEGTEDHANMENRSQALVAKNRGEMELKLQKLQLRQDTLWEANNKGDRFTQAHGEKQEAKINANTLRIEQHGKLNSQDQAVLNSRLTRYFEQVQDLAKEMSYLNDRIGDKTNQFKSFSLMPPFEASVLEHTNGE